jgi:hypothetical protein
LQRERASKFHVCAHCLSGLFSHFLRFSFYSLSSRNLQSVTLSSSRHPRPRRHVLEVTVYPDTFSEFLRSPARIVGSNLDSRSHVRTRECCQLIIIVIDSGGRDCQL